MTGTISLLGGNGFGFAPDLLLAGATIELGPKNGDPLQTGPIVPKDDPAMRLLGGTVGAFANSFPQNLALTTYNVAAGADVRAGLGGRVEFRTDADRFDLSIYANGSNADFSLFVDGLLVSRMSPDVPADGSLRWVRVDLSETAVAGDWKTIELEFRGGANFGGMVLEQGASLAPTPDPGPRIVFLGDSITEGGGARSPGEDWVSLVARQLGLRDVWQSGLGGTGYDREQGPRPDLADRIAADGVAAEGDIYVIAMGLNDQPGVFDEAVAVLSALGEARPAARILVLTSWNPGAPNPGIRPEVDAEIRAAADLFDGVVVLDASRVAFTTFDGTHPDAAGQWQIAEWLTAELEQIFALPDPVEQHRPGDAVGTLFAEGYDPAQQWSWDVLEDGVPTTRYEIVDGGDAFPLLALAPGRAEPDAGEHVLTITGTGSDGTILAGKVRFEVSALPGTGTNGHGFRLFAPDSLAFEIGGTGTVTGTRGVQDVTLLDVAGFIELDPSFNAGGDIVRLSGDASDWTIERAGSSAYLSDGDTALAVPIGPAGIALAFDDGTRTLFFDAQSGKAMIGTQALVFEAVPVFAASEGQPPPPPADGSAGRLWLAEGGSAAIGGDFRVAGSRLAEDLSVTHGEIALDPSFNAGGDRIGLPDAAPEHEAWREGSSVILSGGELLLSIPFGPGQTVLAFDGDERSLRYEADPAAPVIGNDIVSGVPAILSSAMFGDAF